MEMGRRAFLHRLPSPPTATRSAGTRPSGRERGFQSSHRCAVALTSPCQPVRWERGRTREDSGLRGRVYPVSVSDAAERHAARLSGAGADEGAADGAGGAGGGRVAALRRVEAVFGNLPEADVHRIEAAITDAPDRAGQIGGIADEAAAAIGEALLAGIAATIPRWLRALLFRALLLALLCRAVPGPSRPAQPAATPTPRAPRRVARARKSWLHPWRR